MLKGFGITTKPFFVGKLEAKRKTCRPHFLWDKVTFTIKIK